MCSHVLGTRGGDWYKVSSFIFSLHFLCPVSPGSEQRQPRRTDSWGPACHLQSSHRTVGRLCPRPSTRQAPCPFPQGRAEKRQVPRAAALVVPARRAVTSSLTPATPSPWASLPSFQHALAISRGLTPVRGRTHRTNGVKRIFRQP